MNLTIFDPRRSIINRQYSYLATRHNLYVWVKFDSGFNVMAVYEVS